MVVGVDADEQISGNTKVDAFIHADLSRLPFRDSVFDVVTAKWVVEHFDNPEDCFMEFARICKDDAIVIYMTPNLLHYAYLLSVLTPFWFHKCFSRYVLGEKDKSFPTRYKVNTPKKMETMMRDAGFTAVEVRCTDSGPVYLGWLTPLYAAGLIYHRLVNHFDRLSPFRTTIIGVFRRQRMPGKAEKPDSLTDRASDSRLENQTLHNCLISATPSGRTTTKGKGG
jgi:SAM-dependent methyltransferase